MRYDRSVSKRDPSLPSELQLSTAYPNAGILVEGTSEMEILVFVPTPEQPLGSFVEAFGDMI